MNVKVSSVGFSAPVADAAEKALDLHQLLVSRPASTFFFRVAGQDMVRMGIHNNDILVVDKSVSPAAGCFAVAVVDGVFALKRLSSARPRYPVWGIVTGLVRSFPSAKQPLAVSPAVETDSG